MERSRMYWDIMGGGYFETMQQEQLAAMEAFFGPHKKYYAIDGGGFPPKALVTGERKGQPVCVYPWKRGPGPAKGGTVLSG